MQFLQKDENKSTRLYIKKKDLYYRIIREIKDYIILVDEGKTSFTKLIYINKMYEVVIKNSSFLLNFDSFTTFFNIMYKKGLEIKNSRIVNKYFVKNCNLFEKIYMNFILYKLKNKNKFNLDIKECECPICFELISNKNKIITNCNHCFHKKCLFNSFIQKETCPICRYKMI